MIGADSKMGAFWDLEVRYLLEGGAYPRVGAYSNKLIPN